MTRSEAKKKLQSLVNKIDKDLETLVFPTIISEKGKVNFVVINSIEGKNISGAKKTIRKWAKENKVKLRWI